MVSPIEYNFFWFNIFRVFMKTHMRRNTREAHKVRNSVIVPYMINMMNMFRGFKITPNILFYNQTMLWHITILSSKRVVKKIYKYISISFNLTSTPTCYPHFFFRFFRMVNPKVWGKYTSSIFSSARITTEFCFIFSKFIYHKFFVTFYTRTLNLCYIRIVSTFNTTKFPTIFTRWEWFKSKLFRTMNTTPDFFGIIYFFHKRIIA